tara:strand:+ start:4481 stop:4621 length:141 start_codon:yes stop_codon:yes gene_type:complete
METFTDDDGLWEVKTVGKRKVMTLVEPAKKAKKSAPKKKASKKKSE